MVTNLSPFKKDDVCFGERISLVDQKVGKFDFSKTVNFLKVATLGAETFASRNFREIKKSRNF